jgi:hypothetical protein
VAANKSEFTDEELEEYRQERMPGPRLAEFEARLKSDPAFRARYERFLDENPDPYHEHSIRAIWVRHRLTCIERPMLIHYHRGNLDDAEAAYIDFHLKVVGCAMCQANLDDLIEQLDKAGG